MPLLGPLMLHKILCLAQVGCRILCVHLAVLKLMFRCSAPEQGYVWFTFLCVSPVVLVVNAAESARPEPNLVWVWVIL